MRDAPLTEKLDVYSLGNAFYCLLTGEATAGELADIEGEQYRVIGNRSHEIPNCYRDAPASNSLVRVIEACWGYDAAGRASIFDVVAMLEEAVGAYPISK